LKILASGPKVEPTWKFSDLVPGKIIDAGGSAMNKRLVWLFMCYGFLAAGTISGNAVEQRKEAKNLVDNPGFELLDQANQAPLDWHKESPREEIAPEFKVDASKVHSGKYAARLSGRGNPGTFGYWTTTVHGIQGGDSSADEDLPTAMTIGGSGFLGTQAYRIRCYFRPDGVDSIARNVWIRVRWKDAKDRELFAQFLSQYIKEGEWFKADQTLIAPLQARSLTLELVLQWTASGTVWWDDISVEEATPPGHRRLKVATVSYEPTAPSTPEENRRFYAEKVATAGKAGVDLVCLGEGITLVSTGKHYVEVAESIPGPTSELLGGIARKYRLYVVAGIYEREGRVVYNTAMLIDREGKVVGKYRKTHLPETEVSGGLTPGGTYPVFKTDFGTVGIQICYDAMFPEVSRSLAQQGAEIILLPIWGDVRGEGYEWDIVARARAIDNAVYLVASNYTNKRSLIINPNGRILADTGGESGMVMAEIDLNARTFERWLSVGSYGEWKNLYPKERRSETYQLLTKTPRE
jgi:predicted amidohydrolase